MAVKTRERERERERETYIITLTRKSHRNVHNEKQNKSNFVRMWEREREREWERKTEKIKWAWKGVEMRVWERWRCGINCTVDDEERFPPFSSFCDFVKYFILNLFLSLLGPYLSPIRTRELFFYLSLCCFKNSSNLVEKNLNNLLLSAFLGFAEDGKCRIAVHTWAELLSCFALPGYPSCSKKVRGKAKSVGAESTR